MKVKSNKEVNIRAFEPYKRNDNSKGILNPGFELEVEQFEGQDINGNSKWYKDKNGDYYWSGGFEEETIKDLTKEDINEIISNLDTKSYKFEDYYDNKEDKLIKDFNLNHLLAIDDSLKLNEGEGINIGIMDHPFPNVGKIFTNKVKYLIDGGVTQAYHGLQMASIIGAFESSSPYYKSICPKSNMISLPVVVNGDKDKQYFISIINEIFNSYRPFEIIINVSLSIKSYEINDLAPYFIKLAENFIVIASAGQDNELLEQKELQWPASLGNILSVGTVTKQFKNDNRSPAFNDKLDIILPEFEYPAFNFDPPSKYKPVKGDSSATAIISGISALLVKKHGILTKTDILKHILKLSDNYTESNLSFIKPINPKL